MSTTENIARKTRLIPVPNWPDYHHYPSIAGLRSLIFNAKSNGFATAFKRVHKRVLIDEAEFFACIDRLNSNGGSEK
jgi:aspartate/methionine/tyrosine aminotransferase